MVTTVGIKLDIEIRERLNKLGRIKDRSSHWLMKKAVAEYLDREERYEREKDEDAARWRQYEDTGEFLSNDAMSNWLDGLATKADRKA